MSQLLRIATAGTVDDGKSTLIGRLLYDSQGDLRGPARRGGDAPAARAARTHPTSRCSPTACGPSASRASPSTSPTATSPRPKRKFIIADTPGHIQYTRNMVTGASTADVALILIDARNGVLEQSRRHAFLATLLGIPHLVVCINKMDLVDYSQERFEEIREEFRRFATKLEVADLTFIPISALTGDNVVAAQRSDALVRGPVAAAPARGAPRRLRPQPDRRAAAGAVRDPSAAVADAALHDFRGYAGTVAGGVLPPGDEVVGAARPASPPGSRRSGRPAARTSTRRSPARRSPSSSPTTSTSPAAT